MLRSLEIFASYEAKGLDADCVFYAEHDQLFKGDIDPNTLTEDSEHGQELDTYGWSVNDSDGWFLFT